MLDKHHLLPTTLYLQFVKSDGYVECYFGAAKAETVIPPDPTGCVPCTHPICTVYFVSNFS